MDDAFIPPPPCADRATTTQILDTVELWPLDWWAVNGPEVLEIAEKFRVALARLRAEPESSRLLRQAIEAAL